MLWNFLFRNIKIMNTPLVSIITATYNSSATLQLCIDSVAKQVYPNIQYIIVDGGSKDETVSIIKNNEGFVSDWISEPDNGVYDAWNKGLKLAKGEWILFLGSDDSLYNDAISNYIDFISSNNFNYDLVSSRIHITNSSNEVIRTFGWPWVWPKSGRVCTIAHPGAFHHTRLFKQYGLYDSNYRICGDYEFLLRAGEKLNAGFMDKITVRMQVGGLSDSYKVYLETFKVVRETGKLNLFVASFDFAKEYSKFIVKRVFRKMGINLALKK